MPKLDEQADRIMRDIERRLNAAFTLPYKDYLPQYDICRALIHNALEKVSQPAPPDAERLYQAANALTSNIARGGELRGREYDALQAALYAYAQSRTAPPDADRAAYEVETTFRLLGLRAAAIHFMASVPPEYRETTAAKDLQYRCKEGFGENPAARWAKKLREVEKKLRDDDDENGVVDGVSALAMAATLESLADEMENRP